ncbi:MAG: nucleotidyltransferase domain-containing protein [Bacteroidales bacterium]|nr:nucleotidyltransferase domain-containing protein [Bacteroidales bacterium]MCF8334067.1 nucleotidyltransferase domain-containing protein [Bacteroidales bacterium]
MDKINAINISIQYLKRLKNNNINFSDAWLFGSYANGLQKDNSDIDLAIILDDTEKTFDTEVKLMIIRRGEETLIEPHAFTKDEFDENLPIVNQIIKNGERIKI